MFPLFQPPPLKGQSLICSVTVHEGRTRRRGQRTYSSNVSEKSEKSKKVVPVCISERCDLVPLLAQYGRKPVACKGVGDSNTLHPPREQREARGGE